MDMNRRVYNKIDNVLSVGHMDMNRILEHIDSIVLKDPMKNKSTSFWEKPHLNTIKLNTDAAIMGNYTALAVVARDNSGKILLAAAKKVTTGDPLVAEASTLLWALQLVVSYQFQHCIIEWDTKNCIDTCNGRLYDCPWSIAAICHDVKSLLHNCPNVVFNWVRRDANSVAHALTKFVAQSQFFSFCNIESLPLFVYEVWVRDVNGSV